MIINDNCEFVGFPGWDYEYYFGIITDANLPESEELNIEPVLLDMSIYLQEFMKKT